MLRLWPWLAAIATGLLCAGCFAPFNYDWLCWIALTPLLAAIWFSGGASKRRWLRDLLLGYVAGLAFFWVVFSWLYTVTVPGMILVGIYMACYFAAWSWLCGLLRPGLRKVRENHHEREAGDARKLSDLNHDQFGVQRRAHRVPTPSREDNAAAQIFVRDPRRREKEREPQIIYRAKPG